MSFTSNSVNQPQGLPTAGGVSLSNAAGVAVARLGRLYLSDPDNHRVLSWEFAASFATGQPADRVLGQPNFTSGDPNHGGVSAHSLYLPQGVFVDANNNLWVADAFNHRVLKFNDPTTDATPLDADLVIGQHDLVHNDENLGLGGTGPHVALPDSLQFPGRVIVHGSDVYVADSGNSRVLHYSAPAANKPSADVVFGQLGNLFCRAKNNDGTCENGFVAAAANMKNPIGIALDAAGRFYVADWANNRVLRFDHPLSSQNPDAVLGQPDFNSSWFNNGGPTVGLGLPIDVGLDSRGGLFVADSGNNRVLRYSHPGEAVVPDCVFGQLGSMTSVDANHGLRPFDTDAEGLFGPTGVVTDRAGNLYVADTNNQRVLRFVRGCGFGDMSNDGTVDNADAAIWLTCVAGPGVNVPPAGCTLQQFECADLDADGDVDLADYRRLQTAFNPGG
jgi:sugar lactone lactonase YvrE